MHSNKSIYNLDLKNAERQCNSLRRKYALNSESVNLRPDSHNMSSFLTELLLLQFGALKNSDRNKL